MPTRTPTHYNSMLMSGRTAHRSTLALSLNKNNGQDYNEYAVRYVPLLCVVSLVCYIVHVSNLQ